MSYETALAALADPTRRQVFERLQDGPLAVVDIARGLPVSRPAVSQHLAVLRRAQLVREQRDGRRNVYAVDPRGLAPLRQWLDALWRTALERFVEAVEAEEEDDVARADREGDPRRGPGRARVPRLHPEDGTVVAVRDPHPAERPAGPVRRPGRAGRDDRGARRGR